MEEHDMHAMLRLHGINSDETMVQCQAGACCWDEVQLSLVARRRAAPLGREASGFMKVGRARLKGVSTEPLSGVVQQSCVCTMARKGGAARQRQCSHEVKIKARPASRWNISFNELAEQSV